ncbi:MAG: RNA polymerase sigma factor [Lachnospiraceae bacterium]|nr:RNA polymerase sigma factor [Lachnospiraceae bacterium]
MDNGAINYRRFRDKEDKNALIEIIKEYKDDLMYFLYSNVRDINVAEDLTEDTFVLLGTKKPKDKQDCSFKTWLYTIGRNLAIDYLRKRLLFTASQAVIVTGFATE